MGLSARRGYRGGSAEGAVPLGRRYLASASILRLWLPDLLPFERFHHHSLAAHHHFQASGTYLELLRVGHQVVSVSACGGNPGGSNCLHAS